MELTLYKFTVDLGLDGIVGNQGSGYSDGLYNDQFRLLVELVQDRKLTITGTTTVTGTITNTGSTLIRWYIFKYRIIKSTNTDICSNWSWNPGSPPPNNVYNIDGNVQPVLNLIKGNTGAFDVSDSSLGTSFYFQSVIRI